jgi:hypothetical protein
VINGVVSRKPKGCDVVPNAGDQPMQVFHADTVAVIQRERKETMMPKLSSMIKSSYLKPKDVPKDGLTLTIKKVQRGSFTDRKTGETSQTDELVFVELPKRLSLNNANLEALIAHFGDILSEQMPDKEIRVVRVRAMVYGEMKWVVRIEPPDDLKDGDEEDETDLGEGARLADEEMPF